MPRFDAHVYFVDSPFSHAMATPEGVLTKMQRHDINGVALISGLAADCDFETGNRQLRDVLDPARGLFGYVTLNADYPTESQEQQRLYLGRREFVGAVMFGHDGIPVTLEDAREVLNAQRRYTKPMAIHVPDAEAVHAAVRIAAEFPAMKFIFLSMGGDHWHAAVTAAKQYLNVYLEISGSLDTDKVSRAAETLTPRKLLYGSGAPYSDPELTIGLVEGSTTLTRSDTTRVYSHNAMGLFNLNAQSDTE